MRTYSKLKESQIEWAAFRSTGPFLPSKGNTASQKKGLAYERKVLRHYVETFELRFFPSQWIVYGSGGKTHWAQLDGLLLLEDPARVVILEVKLSHTAQAYWQVENLYRPLVQYLFRRSNRRVCAVEITKWYDCAVAFPCRPRLLPSILAASEREFGVHILNRN